MKDIKMTQIDGKNILCSQGLDWKGLYSENEYTTQSSL